MRYYLVSGGGAQDLLDDPELAAVWERFIEQTRLPPQKGFSASDLDSYRSASIELVRLTPQYTSGPRRTMKVDNSARPDSIILRAFGSLPPNIDVIDPEDLVDNLDAIAKAVMGLISTNDLLALADILEVQLLDRGLCAAKESHSTSDDVGAENVYTILQKIEPSPTASSFSTKNQLHKAFPSSIRLVLRAHTVIRLWVVNKIAAPGIAMHLREERIGRIMRAIEICRLQSLATAGAEDASLNTPVTPSFVETALLAALWSPESRLYSRTWANIAASRHVYVDSMQTLFSSPPAPPHDPHHCSVDGGWMFEQLLAVLSLPDTIVRNDQILVNFDKRRWAMATLPI